MMRKFLYIVIFISTIIGCKKKISPYDLRFRELHEVKIPQYVRKELPNGVVVFLIEDHTIPLAHFCVYVRFGKICDPIDKTGLAKVLMEVLRTGGTESYTGDEIDSILESTGAEISTWVENTRSGIEGYSLRDDFETILGILYRMLTSPVFDTGKINLAKINLKTQIARRNDRIGAIAWREFRRLVYGKDSPYARVEEYRTVNAITRADLFEFHKKYFKGDNFVVGIWGDFDSVVVTKFIEKLKRIPKGGEKLPYQEIKEAPPSINIAFKEDVNQTCIIIGHLGMKMDNPDYPKAVVMSRILGGGWGSRFFTKLRAEKGLAYSIWAYQVAEYDYPGMFVADAQTKVERTTEAIELMLEEIKKIREELPTDRELYTAREGILNTYAFWFAKSEDVIRRLMRYEFYGYPLDYLEQYRKGIESTNKEDVLRVAKEYIHPDKLIILVVGPPGEYINELAKFGKLDTIDISIPQE